MTDGADISSLILKAARLHQAGRVQEAETIYDDVLSHTPANVDALNLKGVIAADAGRHQDAIDWFDRAIIAQSTASEPLFNKALSLTALGDNAGAIAAYADVIARNAAHADARVNHIMLLHQLGRRDAALAAAKEMTQFCPKDGRGFYNLAFLSLHSGEHEEAAAAAARARALKPTSADVLGLCAEVAFACNDFDVALDLAQQALALNGNSISAHRVLGDVGMRNHRYEAARLHYERALALQPGLAEIRTNYALLLAHLGRHAESAAQYREALRLQPDNAQARHGLALVLLALGNFAEGWPLYATRDVSRGSGRDLSQRPLMFAPPQAGKSLRLLCDQGLGEQTLFSSLLPELLSLTPDIEIFCEPRLRPLLARSFPQVRFIDSAEAISGTLADAARWLRPSFESFPHHVGYFHADAERRDALRNRYRGTAGGPIIGISWMTGGNPKYAGPKSIPLQNWRPLLSQRDATFVSLQYGDVGDEIAALNREPGLNVLLDNDVDTTNDIDDFASQVAAMDLVITTSNTTAHIAGALNVPTLVLVPLGFGGIWHWFLEREDSPWYPSARLIRQTRQGDWEDALQRAAGILASFIAARPRTLT